MRRKWQQSAASGWSHFRLSEEIDRALEQMDCNGVFNLGRLLARVEDCQERDAEDANAEIERLREKLQELPVGYDAQSVEEKLRHAHSEIDRLRKLLRDAGATEDKLRLALQENRALRAELEECND